MEFDLHIHRVWCTREYNRTTKHELQTPSHSRVILKSETLLCRGRGAEMTLPFKGPFSGRHQDYRPYRFVKESSKFKTVFLWLSINFFPWKFVHHLFGTWKTSFSRLEISTSPAIMRNLSFKIISFKFLEKFSGFPTRKNTFHSVTNFQRLPQAPEQAL